MWYMNEGIGIILGKTLVSVDVGSDEIRFVDSDGVKYLMYHEQDCCEHVTIEDVCGDVNNLVDYPITLAEEVVSGVWPDDVSKPEYVESFTWTFYKLATVRGYVTIRWYGTSNGYYSERVNFCKVNNA